MKDFRYLQQKYLVGTYPNRDLVFTSGQGQFLINQSGQKYLDMMGNYGVNLFGYNHPLIQASLTCQLKKLTTLHCSFTNDVRAQASQNLVQACGGHLSQVYFSNSGAEAIEAALKFAVLATGKKQFIACRHAYHGKTLGALSATDGQKYKAPFFPLIWDFNHINFNDTSALKSAIGSDTAAFIIEPVQGEGGVILPDPNYLKKISQICRQAKILLIIDEIQTGTGRTGHFLASHSDPIEYDIVCLGKGLAGGIPVGATLVNQKISQKIPKLIHSSTFGGNPLACAGILAVLKLLDPKTLKHIRQTGDYLISQLKLIKSDQIKQVRGSGLMIGIDVNGDRNQILKLLQSHKILAIPAGDSVIRLLPSLVITKKDIDYFVKIFKKCVVSS